MNVCDWILVFPPKLIGWGPHLQCDGVLRQAFGGIIGFRSGALVKGLVPIEYDEDNRRLPPPSEGAAGSGPLQASKRALTSPSHANTLLSDSGTQNCEKKCLLLKSLWLWNFLKADGALVFYDILPLILGVMPSQSTKASNESKE